LQKETMLHFPKELPLEEAMDPNLCYRPVTRVGFVDNPWQ